MAWLVFMGWVISQANEGEDYSNYFGEGTEISRNWATAHFLISDGRPQNCHGTGGCVTQLMLICYNKHIMKLKVHWKSNLPPSWIWLVLTSFCHVLWLCHSFKVVPCPLTSCFTTMTLHSSVTLSLGLDFSEPQFPLLLNGDGTCIHFIWVDARIK